MEINHKELRKLSIADILSMMDYHKSRMEETEKENLMHSYALHCDISDALFEEYDRILGNIFIS